ncbi:BZ3500_MvSof-1268-A1-R1_Chr8-2g10290 [Microbotryum saponariae]|uniref:BZ3500_MvSof-1268-A1-R1_Chr8-2g10290 protein n=1 Tax=Microbotryum saponariae TaxID=289078 RepID=A0A2X0LAM7_9BASI|nr:BZ3500_MvSof-1268-A1-R1_Chr8-2g10290 [Microbotryum saponariae]SDA02110.1 BZ3501_MvSof-1269-A2-R1_Chr8-2g10040 [Microbotryum saponariae]
MAPASGSAAASQEILRATIKDVRSLASMLRALSFRPTAVVEIRQAGIKFTVELGRSVQANAYLQAEAFDSYQFSLIPPGPSATSNRRDGHTPSSEDPFQVEPAEGDINGDNAPFVAFGVSISTILECLNIFGNAGSGSASGGSTGFSASSGRQWSGGGAGGAGGGQGAAGMVHASEFGTENHGGGRRRGGDEDRGEREAGSAIGGPGSTTTLEMTYRGEGYPLVLLLEEGGIVTRCEITTYEPDDLMELFFDDQDRVMKFIMKSGWLADAFSELDPSSDRVSFSFSPSNQASTRSNYNRYATEERLVDSSQEIEAPLFRLESVGDLGSTEMDYPNDKDVLETFECQGPMRNSYKYSQIQLIQKALNASIKTSLRTAADGLMSFQFMIPIGKRTTKADRDKFAFVEFLDDEY